MSSLTALIVNPVKRYVDWVQSGEQHRNISKQVCMQDEATAAEAERE